MASVRADESPPTAKPRDTIAKALDSIGLLTDNATAHATLATAAKAAIEGLPDNVLVRQQLTEALQAANAAGQDHRKAANALRVALRETLTSLDFKIVEEAKLPEGFPQPTPVGEIRVKDYPTYRLARTNMTRGDGGAFWTLFQHIKKNEIAMTAPVEMTYTTEGDHREPAAMAFLYGNTKLGTPGTQGNVQVEEIAPMTTVSIGMRAGDENNLGAKAAPFLEAWLKEHPEYQVTGPLRVMGYNSPFIPARLRYQEVEIPVKRTGDPRQ